MLKVDPIIRNETKNIAIDTGIGTLIMWIVFFVLNLKFPETVPFDYTVFLGGICGSAVAVLNFFLMGMTIQNVVDSSDNKNATSSMRKSYLRRMLLQMGWVVIAILAPCFQFAAGILPLFFPGIGIKLVGIFTNKNKDTGGEP